MPAPHDDPFSEDNRAYQRFIDLTEEHFDSIIWRHDPSRRPVVIDLIDVGTGDRLTLAVIRTRENITTHILLAVTPTGRTSAHGPFAGPAAVQDNALATAMADPHIAVMCGLRLHPPTVPMTLAWVDGPPGLPIHPTDRGPRTDAVIVLLVHRGRLAAIGPFLTPAEAGSWTDTSPHAGLDRLILDLHPPVSHRPTG
jgi:hypothetical protein